MPRARLLIAYDGAAFHGFAENDGVPTVGGTLRLGIERLIRQPVELTCAGRTDAGVHGWGQVVSLDLPAGSDLGWLRHRLNRMLAQRIAIRSAEWTDDAFDARFSARWRHYRYQIMTSDWADPFLARSAWHVGRPLDVDAMQLAADAFVGEHDFSSFCRRPKPTPGQPAVSLVRRVLLTAWSEPQTDLLRFEIRANAFCHQMVRSIVGTLVDVGLRKRSAGDTLATLHARDRRAAGPVAPPHGLVLWEVGY